MCTVFGREWCFHTHCLLYMNLAFSFLQAQPVRWVREDMYGDVVCLDCEGFSHGNRCQSCLTGYFNSNSEGEGEAVTCQTYVEYLSHLRAILTQSIMRDLSLLPPYPSLSLSLLLLPLLPPPPPPPLSLSLSLSLFLSSFSSLSLSRCTCNGHDFDDCDPVSGFCLCQNHTRSIACQGSICSTFSQVQLKLEHIII